MAVETTTTPAAGPGQASQLPPGRWLLEVTDDDMSPTLKRGDWVEVDRSAQGGYPAGIWVLAEWRGGAERLLFRRLDRIIGNTPACVRITTDNPDMPQQRIRPVDTLDIRGRVCGALIVWGKGAPRPGITGEVRS